MRHCKWIGRIEWNGDADCELASDIPIVESSRRQSLIVSLKGSLGEDINFIVQGWFDIVLYVHYL